MSKGKTSKIATTIVSGFRHRDGNFKDRSLATQTRQYTENKTPKERTDSIKPGRGVDNPVK